MDATSARGSHPLLEWGVAAAFLAATLAVGSIVLQDVRGSGA